MRKVIKVILLGTVIIAFYYSDFLMQNIVDILLWTIYLAFTGLVLTALGVFIKEYIEFLKFRKEVSNRTSMEHS